MVPRRTLEFWLCPLANLPDRPRIMGPSLGKKIENHEHAIAFHFMHYTFVRRHRALKVSPAMAAGVDSHLWSLKELIELIDQQKKNAPLSGGAGRRCYLRGCTKVLSAFYGDCQ